MSGIAESAVFDFLLVRAPNTLEASTRRSRFVTDRRLQRQDRVAEAAGEADLRSLTGRSEVAKTIADAVTAFISAHRQSVSADDFASALTALQNDLTRYLIVRRPFGADVQEAPRRRIPVRGGARESGDPPAVTLEELEDGAYLTGEGTLHLFRDRLSRLEPQNVIGLLDDVHRCLWAAVHDSRAMAANVEEHPVDGEQPADREQLADEGNPANKTFEAFRTALAVVLRSSPERYVLGLDSMQERWGRAQAIIFDALYVCYVGTRFVEVNLDPLMEALRALHALRSLALDEVVARLTGRAELNDEDKQTLARAEAMWPELAGWDREGAPAGFPLVGTAKDLEKLLRAPVSVHPIFAQLFRYLRPFNPVRPIGVGDLKVVRQRLVAYLPGEISHIHNIMKGETRTRSHRRLERTEELFQATGSRAEEGTSDTQTTDRFELKTEADAVIKSMLNVNATASVTSTGKMFGQQITASAGGGFAYNRSTENHTKTAQNFARDVVSKAVERVETRTTTTRSTTKLFETEERNNQTLSGSKENLSGIYRWLDKRYEGQVYNYGRRTMYEFTIPEPAAHWVAARLLAAEAEFDVPQPPVEPADAVLALPVVESRPLQAKDINAEVFDRLQQEYDFGDLRFPPAGKTVTVINRGDGSAVFTERDLTDIDGWDPRSFAVTIPGAAGYVISGTQLSGLINYHNNGEGAGAKANKFTPSISGQGLTPGFTDTGTDLRNFWFGAFIDTAPIPLELDENTLVLGLQNVKHYRLSIDVRLVLDSALRGFQDAAFAIVRDAELARVDAVNKERKLAYEAELATYRNRLAELDALQVADVLQGGAEAANRAVMDEEIKRACISALTREFDDDPADDLLPKTPAMSSIDVSLDVTRFSVMDKLAPVAEGQQPPGSTTAGFVTTSRPSRLPAADLANSRINALTVQFIEQAFEWERISYLFYPYYWAQRGHWLELMRRSDGLDPTFSAFLRAGMARVLISVTPDYECAVRHYMCTREPWKGACEPPVIDDELFVPLFEEVREQSFDDREGGTPEGAPWTFTVPTTLVYLHDNDTPLPDLEDERRKADGTG